MSSTLSPPLLPPGASWAPLLPPDTASRYDSVSDARLRVPLAECRGSPNSAGGDGARVGRLHAQPCPLPAQPCRGDPGNRSAPGGVAGGPPIKAKGSGSDALGAHSLGFALRGGERAVIQSDAP